MTLLTSLPSESWAVRAQELEGSACIIGDLKTGTDGDPGPCPRGGLPHLSRLSLDSSRKVGREISVGHLLCL